MNIPSLAAASAAIAILLSGCKTTEDLWTEWKPIHPSQSVVAFASNAASVDGIRFEQARSTDNGGGVREQWFWDGGALYMQRLPSDRYHENDFGKQDLYDELAHWERFSREDFPTDTSSIRAGRNRIGPFHYDVRTVNGETCFLFLQPIPVTTPAGYEEPNLASSSHGFINAFDCRTGVDPERYENSLLRYVGG